MSPEEVVETSLQYQKKGKVLCVPGSNNKFISFLPRLLPRSTIYKIAMSVTLGEKKRSADRHATS